MLQNMFHIFVTKFFRCFIPEIHNNLSQNAVASYIPHCC